MNPVQIATLIVYAIAFAFLIATGINIERAIRQARKRTRRP